MDLKTALLYRVVGSLLKVVAALGRWAVDLSLRIEGTPAPKAIQEVQDGMADLATDGAELLMAIVLENESDERKESAPAAKNTAKKAGKKAASKGGS